MKSSPRADSEIKQPAPLRHEDVERPGIGKGGDNKAVLALGHTMLVITWHLLSNGSTYEDLGGDYFARRNDAEARKRYLIRQLEALGQRVTVESAA